MLPTRLLLQVYLSSNTDSTALSQNKEAGNDSSYQLTKNLENIYRLVYSKYIGYPVVHAKLMYTVKFSLSNNTSKIALA